MLETSHNDILLRNVCQQNFHPHPLMPDRVAGPSVRPGAGPQRGCPRLLHGGSSQDDGRTPGQGSGQATRHSESSPGDKQTDIHGMKPQIKNI